MIEVRAYIDASGRCPFARWLDGLRAPAHAKVQTAIARMELGNLSNVRLVLACRSSGSTLAAGYRIYFGREGDT